MNILIITPYLPYPLSSGGAQGVFNMIENLRHKHHFTMIINEGGQNNEANRHDLQQLWPDVDIIYYPFRQQLMCPSFFYEKTRRVLLRKFAPNSRKLLIETTLRPYGEWFSSHHVNFVHKIIKEKKIDLVEVNFIESLPWVNHLPESIKKVFIHHELGFVRKERLLKNLQLTSEEQAMLKEAKERELTDLGRYDAVITVTQVDKDILLEEGLSKPVYAAPLAISTKSQPYSVRDKQLTFVGGYGHAPNIEGIEWFTKCVCPHLRQEGLTFNLVGTHWPESYSNSSDIKVERKGFVENLSSVASGTIMIVPILSGSGMRMKILEAAAMSLPIVTTSVGVEGLDFENGVSCIIGNDPNSFANAIINLCHEPKLREMLGKNANSVFREKYSVPVLASKRDDIYTTIMNS